MKRVIFFFLSYYTNSDELLVQAIKYLMQRKYNGYKVYIHNFGRFDGIFLLKVLTSLSNRIKPLKRETLISVKFYFGKYHLNFVDSYALFKSSLSKLASSFSLYRKTIFPYRFVDTC